MSLFLLKGGDTDACKEVVHEKDKRRITPVLGHQGLSKRKAAGSCGVSGPTVDDYLRRAEAAGQHLVAEDLAPVDEALVGGEDEAGLLIAALNEPEQQTGIFSG